MITVWRYTTIHCRRVYRLYRLAVWTAPVAAVAIPCGGYVAGRLLPDLPPPAAPAWIEPGPAFLPPLPLLPPLALVPPDMAYMPGGVVGGWFPPVGSVSPGARRAIPGETAGGALYAPPAYPLPKPPLPSILDRVAPDLPAHDAGPMISTPPAVRVPAPPVWAMFPAALLALLVLHRRRGA